MYLWAAIYHMKHSCWLQILKSSMVLHLKHTEWCQSEKKSLLLFKYDRHRHRNTINAHICVNFPNETKRDNYFHSDPVIDSWWCFSFAAHHVRLFLVTQVKDKFTTGGLCNSCFPDKRDWEYRIFLTVYMCSNVVDLKL